MQAEIYGKPLKVFDFSSNNFDEIEKLFNHPKIRERKVVILSIVGAFRRGKSFYLDYCLRYLYGNYDSISRTNKSNDSDWFGEEGEKLSGFSWRSGCDRDTTGILFWSDVFLLDRNGEKLAIFIADSQGLFDNDTTSGENVKIFSISSLFSSVQIINLTGNIREDELQYVSFAMEFAKHVKSSIERPYQKIIFLIRDWQSEEDFAFGPEGGKRYLQKVLKGSSEQEEEVKSIREFLQSACEELQCFLLPHPGKNVAGKKSFDGSWGVMDKDFRDELKRSVETLLKAENLKPKKISGKEVTAKEFFPYIKQYFQDFASKKIPKAETLFESMIRIEMDQLVEKCFNTYDDTVKASLECYSIKKKDQILKIHQEIKTDVLADFRSSIKLGKACAAKKTEELLMKKIEENYKMWSEKKINQLDNEQIQREHEDNLKFLLETEKRNLTTKMESIKAELANARVVRSLGSSREVSSSSNPIIFEPSYSSPTPNYAPSFAPSSSRASTPSSGNSWHQHQKNVSANVWSKMSSSERKSAGNFNSFAAASYRKGKH